MELGEKTLDINSTSIGMRLDSNGITALQINVLIG
jgi:hypothetical protein